MKIIYFSKRQLGVGFIILAVALIITTIPGNLRIVNNYLYKVREAFPPLIYLPNYQQGPPVYAGSSVLIESGNGAILFAKDPDQRRAPASTTKMMTAVVALEKGRLDQMIQVSPRAARTPGSSIWLKPGDRLILRELLEGMMLQSGNDGSMAVAEGIAGSMEKFIALMNLKAKEIGALNTNFQNPHGLRAPSHFTTALDLALIARYGLRNPVFAELVKQKTATLEWADNKGVPITNTNRLLWYLEGVDGVKTGTTNEAGHCLVASATRDGRQLIAVVLNSRDRWGDCVRLLDYGFKEFTTVKVADRYQPVYRLKIHQGKQLTVDLYPRVDLIAVVKRKDQPKIIPKIIIHKEPISAPIKIGQVVGKIGYQYQEQLIEGIDLITLQPVRRKWWLW